MQELLKVRFTCGSDGGIKGKIFSDLGANGNIPRTRKIVLINGYFPDRRKAWVGELPKDGEWWLCEEIRDTKPEEIGKGAILVRLREKLTFVSESNSDDSANESDQEQAADSLPDNNAIEAEGCRVNPDSLFVMLRKRAP